MPVLFISDFSGGLNTKFRQNTIPDKESPSLRNVRFSRLGSLTKRFGSSIVGVNAGSATGACFGLSTYALSTMTAEKMIIVTRDNPGKVWTTTDGTAFTNAFSLTGNDLTGQNWMVHFLTFGDAVYLYAEYMNTVSWDNSSASVITASTTTFPKARHAAIYQGRIFTGYIHDGASLKKSRLKWSDANSATSWTSTNVEDVAVNDGGVITGVFAYGSELLIFKGPDIDGQSFLNSGLYSIVGTNFDATNPTYGIVKIPLPYGVGLISANTISVYKGALIFLTNDGFYAYRGGLTPPEKISFKIQNRMDTIASNASVSQDYRKIPAAIFHDNKYYCSAMQSLFSPASFTGNDSMLILDGENWFTDIISKTTDDFDNGDVSPIAFVKFLGRLYGIPSTTSVLSGISTGVLRRLEVADSFAENLQNDAAASVNARYVGKEMDFFSEQNFDTAFIHLRRQSSGTLTYEYDVNQRGAQMQSIDMTAPDVGTTENSSSLLLRKQVNIGRRGRTIQFGFANGSAVDFEIYAIELHYAKVPSTREAKV